MAMFKISGRLPSLNELIRWDRIVGRRGRGRFYGAIKRRQAINLIAGYIWDAHLPKFPGPVDISIRWIEPNARRDYDNIASSQKFVLDSLVKTGTIQGDSRKWIPEPVKHEFDIDKKEPRVEVTINERREAYMLEGGVP